MSGFNVIQLPRRLGGMAENADKLTLYLHTGGWKTVQEMQLCRWAHISCKWEVAVPVLVMQIGG